MRKSARMSRPMTTSLPATNLCADPSYRTVSSGGAGSVIGTIPIGSVDVRADPYAVIRLTGCLPRGIGDLLRGRDAIVGKPQAA